MLSLAICDDNELFLQELSNHIRTILIPLGHEYALSSFTSGVQLLNSGFFDIIFLDVRMEGIDGIETAQKLRDRGDTCKLVFLSAYKQYVFRAFDVEAVHYLVKPVSFEKLSSVLYRIINNLNSDSQNFVDVKQAGNLTRIRFCDILYIEVIDRKLFLHTVKQTYDSYGKIDQIERKLPDHFFRCHRSYIINFSYVRHYDNESIRLENGESVLISKRRYKTFCHCFLDFLKKGGNPT